ncbi:MAG: VanZ family protein [Rhodoferax sp.]
MHKTAAWPLSMAYAGLIVYASLYPFADWRDQGLSPFTYLWQPLPRYWTGFDVWINIVGYLPFGFLLAVSGLRSHRTNRPVLAATFAAALLSLCMESLQSRLPHRVPSNLDLGLNVLGGWLGAMAASGLERLGALARWSRVRERWLVPDARGGMVLLALWPAALLFPTSIPLGLGQVLERLENNLADKLADTPFLDWLPMRDIELQPMLPGGQMVCVWLGALVPCLLGYCVVRGGRRRAAVALAVLALAVLVTALSSALSFGPAHAWDWLNLPARTGLGAALAVAALLVFAPRRLAAALVLLALGVDLGLLNHASSGPYFEQTLHTWQQGQFIRFNGLAQWLSWLWPFAALFYVVARLSRSEGKA